MRDAGTGSVGWRLLEMDRTIHFFSIHYLSRSRRSRFIGELRDSLSTSSALVSWLLEIENLSSIKTMARQAVFAKVKTRLKKLGEKMNLNSLFLQINNDTKEETSLRDTRIYSIYPSNLDLVSVFCEIEQYFVENGFKEQPNGRCPNNKYQVDIDDKQLLRCRNYNNILKILKKHPHPIKVHIHSHWEHKKNKKEFMWSISHTPSIIVIDIESDDLTFLNGLHEQSRRIFQASNPAPEKSPYLSRYNLKKTVFLAHRFDDGGKNVSDILGKFLRRIGFQIIEGEGYEARDIPQKVRERILTQDIFICLVTPGDSSWLIGETAFAMAHNKYIVIICEEGVEFKKGIVGTDYEHIPFPKNLIEKSFIDIVYALPS